MELVSRPRCMKGGLAGPLTQIFKDINELKAKFSKLELEMNHVAQKYQICIARVQVPKKSLVFRVTSSFLY